MIFNGTNVNGRQIWEREHCSIPKRIKLVFEIGLPVNETQFSKPTVTKYEIGIDKAGVFCKVIIWIQTIIVALFINK